MSHKINPSLDDIAYRLHYVHEYRILVRESRYNKGVTPLQKRDCWLIYNGNSRLGYCFVCKKMLDFEKSSIWHAAHIIPKSQHGSNMASNLRPTCAECNYRCGSNNLLAFKHNYWEQRRWRDPNGVALMSIE